MKPSYLVWFVFVALLAFLVELPREQVLRWYLDRMEQNTGNGLAWQTSAFGFRSGYLDGVDVIVNHHPMLFLDALNATIGLDGSATFHAVKGKGFANGTVSRSDLVFNTDAFPVPGVPLAVVTDLAVKSSGRMDLAHGNGTATFDASGTTGEVVSSMLHVGGKVTATGDVTMKNGGAEIHGTLNGDHLTGRLDVTATPMPGGGAPGLMLEGALNAEVNGQAQNFRIAGTLQAPTLTPAAGTPNSYNRFSR